MSDAQTVLLVEDLPSDARLIRDAIETTRWGKFRVLTASTLAAARAHLAAEHIDAIVTDLGLPDSTGIDTVRALRVAAPATPLVVLTVDDDGSLAQRALAEGAQDHQTKSRLDGDGIGRALRYALLRREMEASREEIITKESELAKAREVDAIRRGIVQLVAHELRTPMTPLVLWLDHIEHNVPPEAPPAYQDAIRNAKRSSERLRRLIEDVVVAARASSLGLPLRRRPTDLGALILESIAEQTPAAARGVALVPKIEAPLQLHADPDRLHNALHAVISNAVKFSPQQGRVDIEAAREQARIVIRVHDEGVGLAPEAIPRLFQPFGIAEDGLKIPSDSRGLGLYLARVIVEGHGGRIRAQSPGEGRGSTFEIDLPRGDLP